MVVNTDHSVARVIRYSMLQLSSFSILRIVEIILDSAGQIENANIILFFLSSKFLHDFSLLI